MRALSLHPLAGYMLVQDLLAVHLVRHATTSTIISLHHPTSLREADSPGTRMRTLIQRTDDSVYWSKIFQMSRDPTFLFLAFLWYPLYAWDKAFEELDRHIHVLVHHLC